MNTKQPEYEVNSALTPFELDKALEGSPVYTLDGRRVENMCVNSTNAMYPLSGYIPAGGHMSWTLDGKFYNQANDDTVHCNDLRMRYGVAHLDKFDLDKALDGYPVVTADGRLVIDIAVRDEQSLFAITGRVLGNNDGPADSGDLDTWTKQGYFYATLPSSCDLFMPRENRVPEASEPQTTAQPATKQVTIAPMPTNVVSDPINPKHYRYHPSGVECIEVTRHMSFNIGNAVKYLWRAGHKNDILEDLRKAAWYVQDEIRRLQVDRLCEGSVSAPESGNLSE